MRKLAAFLVLSICLWTPAGLMPAADEAAGVTAEQAIQSLTEGNTRFAEGKSTHPSADSARRTETADRGQHPFATVLACADSRVPVEIVFDRGIGDLFVVRVAGNICDVDERGSIEYGVEKLGTPVVLVLGHSECGAVNAAVTGAEVHGNIKRLVDKIAPAVVDAELAHPALHGKDLLPAATVANVWHSIESLLVGSPMTRRYVQSGKLKVLGAIYDVKSGKVEWLGEHPKQKELLELAH